MPPPKKFSPAAEALQRRHDGLRHATFLSDGAKSKFSLSTALPQLPPIKTASLVASRDANRNRFTIPSLDAHHAHIYLENDHSVPICVRPYSCFFPVLAPDP
ncbi:hypothetical protein BV22DRAFT_1135401 [Leucogyrophana mollusca]|uniref:Uncharacterized protein n=1 Tax=Leucogyrophana mollusca TaxID=85980 RepID=A0ACB8AY02_9AGAM|nr:hypothetical protein BV22DRAFT_1135401 [Leucogyrophana mollusca]